MYQNVSYYYSCNVYNFIPHPSPIPYNSIISYPVIEKQFELYSWSFSLSSYVYMQIYITTFIFTPFFPELLKRLSILPPSYSLLQNTHTQIKFHQHLKLFLFQIHC